MNRTCPNCRNDCTQAVNFCLHCGAPLTKPPSPSDKIVNCKFTYKCPLEWQNLTESDNENVRFCSTCEKNVYFAHSQSEVYYFAERGDCIAFHPGEGINFSEYLFKPPPLMGMIARNSDSIPPPPETAEVKKKSWWQFWK